MFNGSRHWWIRRWQGGDADNSRRKEKGERRKEFNKWGRSYLRSSLSNFLSPDF